MTTNKTAIMKMTDEARLKFWNDQAEAKSLLSTNKAKAYNAKQEIKDLVKKMTKAAEKEDFAKVAVLNRNIKHQFEMIKLFEQMIEQAEEQIKFLERHENGFGPIQEFLEEMLRKDIQWHSEMHAEHGSKSTKELMAELIGCNMAVATLIKMSHADALKTFKNDMDVRFNKIKKQIEDKVGNVEDFELDRNYNNGLDGFVVGDKATAAINTIVAGGHNIQRAHYRTLVKLVK